MELDMLSPISEDEDEQGARTGPVDRVRREGVCHSSNLPVPASQSREDTPVGQSEHIGTLPKFFYPTPPCPFSSGRDKTEELSDTVLRPHEAAHEAPIAHSSTLQREFYRANLNHPVVKRFGSKSGSFPGSLCTDMFPELHIRRSLQELTTAKDAIGATYSFVSRFLFPPGPLLQVLAEEFVSSANSDENGLALFYLFNEMVFKHHWVKDPYAPPHDDSKPVALECAVEGSSLSGVTKPGSKQASGGKPETEGRSTDATMKITESGIVSYDFRALGVERFINAVLSKFSHISETSRRKMLHCLNVWQKHHIYSAVQCERLRFLITSVSKRIDLLSQAKHNTVSDAYEKSVAGKLFDSLLLTETVFLSLENMKCVRSLLNVTKRAAQAHQNTLCSTESRDMLREFRRASRGTLQSRGNPLTEDNKGTEIWQVETKVALKRSTETSNFLESILDSGAMTVTVDNLASENSLQAEPFEKAWTRSGRCLSVLEDKLALLQEACLSVAGAFEHNGIMLEHTTALFHQNRHWANYFTSMKSLVASETEHSSQKAGAHE